jgi:hypothetical protein
MACHAHRNAGHLVSPGQTTLLNHGPSADHRLYLWYEEQRIFLAGLQALTIFQDIGAQGLKPLFIAMSAVTVVSFDIAFILERWLRHTGRLARNTSVWQKLYSLLSCIAAIVGAAGLILLSIFDTLRHPKLHDIFLCLFIGGYIVSAIFICLEYQRLGIHYKERSILRWSFWIKLAFIVIELALAIAFGVCGNQDKWNTAAVLEWTVSFIFFFYVLSFVIDFTPAIRTKHHQSKQTEMNMQTMEAGGGDADEQRFFRGAPTSGYTDGYANGARTNGYTNGQTDGYANGGHTNGYTNGHTNGHVNGYKNPPASQNF